MKTSEEIMEEVKEVLREEGEDSKFLKKRWYSKAEIEEIITKSKEDELRQLLLLTK